MTSSILNALQGAFIFLIYIVFNNESKAVLKQQLVQNKDLTTCSSPSISPSYLSQNLSFIDISYDKSRRESVCLSPIRPCGDRVPLDNLHKRVENGSTRFVENPYVIPTSGSSSYENNSSQL